MIKKIKICCLIFACSSSYILAQDIDERIQSRFNLGLSHKFDNVLRLKVTVGYRIWDAFGEYNSTLIEPSIKYTIKGTKLSIGGAFRYQHKTTFDEQRYELFANWKKKLFKRTNLNLGVKGQWEIENRSTKTYLIRPAAEISHRVKKTKVEPSIGVEWFQTNKLDGAWTFSKFRLIMGVEKNINKQNALFLGYMRQWNDPVSEIHKFNIVQVSYKIKI